MKARGRMLRKDAASSKKLAALSPKALALFLMLIPHFDSHGKLNGDVRFVKGEVVPLIPWFTIPVIRKALAEIDAKTNVRWFEAGGRWFLHALSWREHQDLREDRLGADLLPSFQGLLPEHSRTTPGVLPREVEGEVEGEVEVEEKGEEEEEVKKGKPKTVRFAEEQRTAPPSPPRGEVCGDGEGEDREGPHPILNSIPSDLRGFAEAKMAAVRAGKITGKTARKEMRLRGIPGLAALALLPMQEGDA